MLYSWSVDYTALGTMEVALLTFIPGVPFGKFMLPIPKPLGSAREKAMAPHSSTLARKIPCAEEPGKLQSMGSRRVGHNWATSLSLFTFMHWRRKWQPTPEFLPGESQEQRSLVGCCLWGRTESDTTEVTQQQQQQQQQQQNKVYDWNLAKFNVLSSVSFCISMQLTFNFRNAVSIIISDWLISQSIIVITNICWMSTLLVTDQCAK